jgi:hypothetical protein
VSRFNTKQQQKKESKSFGVGGVGTSWFALVSHFCPEACGCGRTLFFLVTFFFFFFVVLFLDHSIKFVKQKKKS